MKALKYIIFILLIFIIGGAIYVAVQPNSFNVTRTRTIQAPAAVVYNNIIDFKNWEAWSSWAEADEEMVITLPENTQGVGGSYQWEDKDGVGTMKNTATNANASLTQEMQFGEFPKSDINWTLEPSEDGKSTNVTWNISGKDLPFMFKMFSAFMGGMEKQIGPHYERSLEKLDSILQVDMKRYSVNIEGITNHSGGYYLYNTTSCKLSDFKMKMQEMMPKVGVYALTHNIKIAGGTFALYEKWDEENNAVIFSCCVPTSSKIISNEPDILTGQLPSFKAVKTVLNGDYENLVEAWEKTMAYIEANGLEMVEGGPMMETYLTDPASQPNPANWVTEIYIAVK